MEKEIKFLKIKDNMVAQQNKMLHEKNVIVDDLRKKLKTKEIEVQEAQNQYYTTLEVEDEDKYKIAKSEFDNIKKELNDAESSLNLLKDFKVMYTSEQILGEVNDLLQELNFDKDINEYIEAYNKLIKSVETLDNKYIALQERAKDIYTIGSNIRCKITNVDDIDYIQREINRMLDVERKKTASRVKAIEVKKLNLQEV